MNNDANSKANGFVNLKIWVLFFFAIMSYALSAQNIENSRFKSNPGIVPVMKISNLQKDDSDPMKIDELKIDIRVMRLLNQAK